MTKGKGKKPRITETTRGLAIRAALRAAQEKDAPKAKSVALALQGDGHTISEREVYRIFEDVKSGLTDPTEPWHFSDAASVDELIAVLPVIAYRATSSLYDPQISRDEARVIAALARALPEWDAFRLSQFARNYRDVVRGTFTVPGPPWDPASMEAFVAFAYLDRTEPGTLQRAIADGRVPSFGFVGTAARALTADEIAEESKRKGGGGRGKTRTR